MLALLEDMRDSRIEKWQGWLDKKIEPEVVAMHHHRAVFRKVIEIADNNEELPESGFWGYFQDTYAVTQGAAVRRQAEVSKRVGTLGQLIDEISKEPERLSREYWVGLWEKDPRPQVEEAKQLLANNAFTDQFAPDGGDHLDKAIPVADLRALEEAVEIVTGYVNRHIAHSDLDPRPGHAEVQRSRRGDRCCW